MKITKERTDYALVEAWDSRDSGTDFAIIAMADKLSNKIDCIQKVQESLRSEPFGGSLILDGDDCRFAEIEKLNKKLFDFIERSWKEYEQDIVFIDDELLQAIEKTCVIDDIATPQLRVFGDKLIFQLYGEGGSEGSFLEFCTHYLPVEAFLKSDC